MCYTVYRERERTLKTLKGKVITMMRTTICYKTKEPVYYNKGTKYETKEDEFLAYYCCYENIETAIEEVKRLNTEKPAKDGCKNDIDWNKVAYFFINEQPDMY
jgi:hypothetical protein